MGRAEHLGSLVPELVTGQDMDLDREWGDLVRGWPEWVKIWDRAVAAGSLDQLAVQRGVVVPAEELLAAARLRIRLPALQGLEVGSP